MRNSVKAAIGLMAIALALAAGQVRAETAVATAAKTVEAPVSDTEKTINNIKNPAPWFKWGADLRIRNEYFNNARSLSDQTPFHEQDYFRFRGRIWGSLMPHPDLDFNLRVTYEPRDWINPSFSPYIKNGVGHTGWETSEGIIDTLNLKWRNIGGLPLAATVGRQDILLGDGWLVFEGTPGDGSRTLYFDAARLTYTLLDKKTTIDLIGILQQANNNVWLPTINDLEKSVTDQNEHAAVLWVSNKSIPAMNVDGYFIYKHDTRIHDIPIANPLGDDADLFTIGARLSGDIGEHWRYRAEGAYQFGDKSDPSLQTAFKSKDRLDVSAFGVNSRLSYLFKDPLNNQLHMSYEFLSGDNPNTKGTDEMFDILWGRWPQWSELYIYSYVNETRMSQMANLHRVGPGWTMNPNKKTDVILNYYALLADEETPTRVSAKNAGLFSDDGIFRGHYIQAIVKYKFNPHLAGHLWAEFVMPGNFYAKKDLMSFLRAELYLTF